MFNHVLVNAVENDEKAFRNLFMNYYPSLLSFALNYVETQSVAEDLVQDVFVKVWETRDKLRHIEDFSAYIYQMVRFKCFNYLRSEKVRNNAALSFIEEVDMSEIDTYLREETFRLVKNAMDDLPPACRKIFSMTLEGYAAKDVAEELSIAVETVKKQKQIARKILKEKLGGLFMLFLFSCIKQLVNE